MKNESIKKELFMLRERSEEEYKIFFSYFTKYMRRAIELRYGLADGIEHTLDEIDDIMSKEMHTEKELEKARKDRIRIKELFKEMDIDFKIDTSLAFGRQFLSKAMRQLVYMQENGGICNRKYIQRI